ncbi:MAG: RluA family pseudouridine synthase [Clostridia bacterium]|nr:RluA family pseudouridine synthase [Clostridia bacterium]
MIEIICNEGGVRLDKYINIEDFSRSRIQKLIDDGCVLVNGAVAKARDKVKEGDVIHIDVPEAAPLDAMPEDIELDIVFEDEHMLVINKPQGMVVHAGAGNYSGTLVNALLHHCGDSLSGIGGVARPGIVHRIDKETSGLLLVAKTDLAHTSLSAQIKDKTAAREYICITSGNMTVLKGKIDAPIGRHPAVRTKMAVTSKNSKNAVTHFVVTEQLNDASVVECRLETGRTHQIRVHLAYIGHPILGDNVYGAKTNPYGLRGQALHAMRIRFNHPVTGERMEFYKEPPEYFNKLIETLS